MALEVRELVIKASVRPPAQQPAPGDQAAQLAQLKRELVRECVARVLDELAQAEQR